MKKQQFSADDGIPDLFADCDGPCLSPAQLIAMDALMAGSTQAEAAEAAGKSERWVWSQLNNSIGFQQPYDTALRARQLHLQTLAASRSCLIVNSLSEIASNSDHKECIKACEVLLKIASKA
ncbi:MAG: hypothetical protein ABJZ55_07570 [Fuerstiella sp.]